MNEYQTHQALVKQAKAPKEDFGDLHSFRPPISDEKSDKEQLACKGDFSDPSTWEVSFD